MAVIGRYRIEAKLAEGGTAIVYSALDPAAGRRVALKLLKDEHLDEDARERRKLRMAREAQALSLISHPNVVKVFEVGTIAEHVFIAMELVEGGDFKAWLAEPRTWEEILRAFLAAGQGLAAAHRAGLIHRDFKPHNVMMSADGRVLVTDFGLARPEQAGAIDGALGVALTRTSAVLGTPRYMAPEQHQGLPVDARADQFAFCVSLYEALYAELPFSVIARDDLPIDLSYALEVVQGRVRQPPNNRGIPEEVGALLVRGLQARPEDRHPSFEALLHALAATLPRRRASRAWWALPPLAVGFSAAILAFLLSREDVPELCDTAPEPLLSAEFAAELEQRLRGDVLIGWPRVQSAIAGADASWLAARERACSSAEPETLSCLEEERIARGALIERWRSDPPLAVLAAVIATAEPSCSDGADRVTLWTGGATAWTRWLAQIARSPAVPVPPADAPALRIEAAGLVLLAHGEHQGAERLLRAAAASWSEAGDRTAEGRALASLARARFATGDLAGASEALQRSEALTDAQQDKAGRWIGRAVIAAESGALADAAAALEDATRVLGPEPPIELEAALQRAKAHAARKADRLEDAEAALTRGVLRLTDLAAPDDPSVAELLHDRGLVRWALGNLSQARRDQERAREIWERTFGPGHPKTLAAAEALEALERRAAP